MSDQQDDQEEQPQEQLQQAAPVDELPEGQQIEAHEEEVLQHPLQENPFAQMMMLNQQLQTMDNQVKNYQHQLLLQRPLLEHFSNLLGMNNQKLFDSVTNQNQAIHVIDLAYQTKKSDLEKIVFELMKGYDDMTLKVNLNSLEKIMRILKSNKKSIYITKDVPYEIQQCHMCHHHDHEEEQVVDQNNESQQQKQEESSTQTPNEQSEQEITVQEQSNNQEQVQVPPEDGPKQEENQEVKEKQQQQAELINEQQRIQHGLLERQIYLLRQQKLELERERLILLKKQQQELIEQLAQQTFQQEQLRQEQELRNQETQIDEQLVQEGNQLDNNDNQVVDQQSIQLQKDNQFQDNEQVNEQKIDNVSTENKETEDNKISNGLIINEQPLEVQQNIIKTEILAPLEQPIEENQTIITNDDEDGIGALRNNIAQSKAQIEQLTQQRDHLIQKSQELAVKQQELEQQKNQLLQQLAQEKEKELQQEEEAKKSQKTCISFTDIFGIMSLQNINLSQLQSYETNTDSLIFRLHNNYKIEIKADSTYPPRILNPESLLQMIPPFIINYKILTYLSAFELFMTRSVCYWWKEQVKQTWPQVFKREMFEQLLAKDIRKSIITQGQFLQLKNTFTQRLQQMINALIQIIDWDQIRNQIITKTCEIGIFRPIVLLLFFLNKIPRVDYVHEIDESIEIQEVSENLKEDLMNYLDVTNYNTLSNLEIRELNDKFLVCPEFCFQFLPESENKNILYLTILVNQLYFYSTFRNIIKCESLQLDKLGHEMTILNNRQKYNQHFLEGAYKKLMLQNYQDDITEEIIEQEEPNDQEEAQQFLQSLTNLTVVENPDPDIIIRRNKQVTKIYIDVNTKLDILVSSIEQFKSNK